MKWLHPTVDVCSLMASLSSEFVVASSKRRRARRSADSVSSARVASESASPPSRSAG